jgi:hypothetical protein
MKTRSMLVDFKHIARLPYVFFISPILYAPFRAPLRYQLPKFIQKSILIQKYVLFGTTFAPTLRTLKIHLIFLSQWEPAELEIQSIFGTLTLNTPLHNILEPTTRVTFFNSGSKSDPTRLFPSIVLVIAGEKRFPLPNFNLKIVRIQRGGGSFMLLDVLLHC